MSTNVKFNQRIKRTVQRPDMWALLVSIIFQSLTTDAVYADESSIELATQSYIKCVACHSLEEGKHGVGPSLHNLAGRKAGEVTGFKFSKALRTSGVVWNKESLDRYLLNPQKSIPRNRMAFGGLKNAEERQALVCHLLGKSACE